MQGQSLKQTSFTNKTLNLGTTNNTSILNIQNNKAKAQSQKRTSISVNQSLPKNQKRQTQTVQQSKIQIQNEKEAVQKSTKQSKQFGGTLKVFQQKQKKSENLKQNFQNFLNLEDIIKNLTEGTAISQKQLRKIIENFDDVLETKKPKPQITDKNKNLQIQELKCIQTEQEKKLISLFWQNVIQEIISKNKALSKFAVLQAIKLHIKWNKETYTHEGKFNIKIFPKQMYQKLNNKIPIDRKNSLFKKVVISIQDIFFTYFKGMKIIFLEIKKIKQQHSRQVEGPLKNFNQSIMVKPTLNNLINSFSLCLQRILQSEQQNFYIIQSIFICISAAYQAFSNKFSLDNLFQLLKTFQNFSNLFNNLSCNQNLKKQIEKLIINCLMIAPLKPQKWSQDLKNSIQLTQLNILKPFNLILNQNNYKTDLGDCTQINGQNWTPFINFILKTQSQKMQFLEENQQFFIFSLICKILKAHSDDFWNKDPEFDLIKNYIVELSFVIIQPYQRRNLKQTYKVFRIMISLLGKNKQEKGFKFDYPLNLIYQNADKVFFYFSKYILNISSHQLFQILQKQLSNFKLIRQSQENEDLQNNQFSTFTILQLYCKLLISQPSKFIQIFETLEDQKQFIVMLLNQKNLDSQNCQFIKILFGTLDNLLYNNNSKSLVIKILNQLQQSQQISIHGYCQNIQKIQCLSKHAYLLIQSGFYDQIWTQNIMNFLYTLSKKMSTVNLNFYAKLLTLVFVRLSASKISLHQVKKLKTMINFDFISQYCQYILNFKYNSIQKRYVNKMLKTKNIKKLFEGLAFINSLLLLYISQNQQKQSQFQFLPPFIKRNLVLNNSQGKNQLNTQDNELTSYLVGYIVILMNAYQQNPENISQICPDFSAILYEGLQSLIKSSQQIQMSNLFKIYKPFSFSKVAVESSQFEFLQKFKHHVIKFSSPQGLQILLIGNLCDFQFAKKIVDEIRIALQNNKIFKNSSNQRKGKILSCLSRYFYFAINQMFNKRGKILGKQLKDHLQFLLETLVNQSGQFFKQGKCKRYIKNILSNIYKSFLLLQCFNRNLFVKWIKNYHRLLLHKINFSFQEQKQNPKKTNFFSEQYYKICQMFLCCIQFLNQKQKTEIINIETLQYSLKDFIFNLLEYTHFQNLSYNISQLTLQLIINALKFYNQIDMQIKQKKAIIYQMLKILTQKKRFIKSEENLLILQLCLNVYLENYYQIQDINTQQAYWPLKLNNLQADSETIFKILEMLKIPQHKIFFVSCCNAIAKFILQQQFQWRDKNSLQKIFDLLRISFKKQSQNYNSYQTIWYLQFLELICLQQKRNQFELAQKIAKFIFSEQYFLRRLGFLINKLSMIQKGKNIEWMNFNLNNSNYYVQDNFSFAQKLQLCQILKLINFLMVNSKWILQYQNELILFLNSVTGVDFIFLHLLTSESKISPQTQQQKKAYNIKIQSNQFAMKESGFNRFDRQIIKSSYSKINNYFELTHCIQNIQITSQYILLILAILNFEKQQPLNKTKYFQRDWGNSICLKFLQSFSNQYITLKQANDYMSQIMQNFTNKYYTKSLKLAEEMYFTNNKNLTTFLTSTPQQFQDLLKSNVELLFQAVYSNLKYMKTNLNKDYQQDWKTLNHIINQIKKELPSKNNESRSDFQFNKYLGLQDLKSKNSKMKNTIKSRTVKTLNRSEQRSIEMFNF